MTDRDYNHSRPLDVHRWSNFPEVNTFIDKLYDNNIKNVTDNATFQWFHENFDIIIKNASYQIQSFEDFVKDKWLFTLEARMSQLGFGKIQDLEDSYRVYLIEAKNGNKYAIKWRDELKEKLSETSINLATCLAKKAKRNKKGVYEYPNWFSKLMC